ncbi:MAG: GC-type dockerin domain-anchored protein [Planctomycetota bacterium]|nr:GC-type dockerin domain-anchored protein [Planctomycetota bacterium]
MKIQTTTAALMLTLTAGLAFGQSLNIDIDRASGTGSGVSASTYGAASGMNGVWTSVLPSNAAATTLLTLGGVNSGVTITRTGDSSSSGSTATTGSASTDYSRLIYDYSDLFGPNDQVTYTLNGLDQGFYRLYVYACIPGTPGFYTDGFGSTVYHGTTIGVELGGSTVGYATTTGPVVGGTFQKGVTHNVFNVLVGAGAPALAVQAYPSDNSYFAAKAALNGMQLVKITATRIYVDASATAGLQTGLTWSNAFTNLDDALDMAKASGGQITEIWVANGVYKPFPINSRSASFDIPSGVKLYGGFAGGETRLSDRDPSANVTLLSGEGTTIATTDNLYHVVTMVGCNSSTLLDGFEIRSGRADQNSTSNGISSQTGGGLVIKDGFPKIKNCVFGNNYALLEGGAVMIQGTASPDFSGNTFIKNSAGSYGGAIRCTTTNSATQYLYNNRFLDNDAGINGGAINTTGGTMQFANSTFIANTATSNGGAVYCFSPTVRFYNCTIASNSACTYGGVGVAFGGTASVNNTMFFGNTDSNASTSLQAGNFGGDAGTTLSLNYSRLQGLDNTIPGSGNISSTPTFKNPSGPDGVQGTMDDDWSLDRSSAGVDAGNNSLLPIDYFDTNANGSTGDLLPFDLAGLKRRVDVGTKADTGLGTAPIVDMGAYETPYCPADFNNDGFLDFTDFDDFVAAFEAGSASSDFNGDSFLDFTDFDAFVAAFEAGC